MRRYTTLSLPSEDEQIPERPAAPAVAEERVAAPVEVEPLLDPPGKWVEVDGRVLSERLMFAYGFGGFTFVEIADEFAASVLWVEVAVRSHPWLEEARAAGVMARDRDRVIRSHRAADKLIDGYSLTRQALDKTSGEVVDLKDEVGPNPAMVVKVLETRDREKYGKDARPVEVHITMGALEAARGRAAQAVNYKEVQDG